MIPAEFHPISAIQGEIRKKIAEISAISMVRASM
jgi:hypothetical protein